MSEFATKFCNYDVFVSYRGLKSLILFNLELIKDYCNCYKMPCVDFPPLSISNSCSQPYSICSEYFYIEMKKETISNAY